MSWEMVAKQIEAMAAPAKETERQIVDGYVVVSDIKSKPRLGVQCGRCHTKFEPQQSYYWSCKDARCPFDYGPHWCGVVEAPEAYPKHDYGQGVARDQFQSLPGMEDVNNTERGVRQRSWWERIWGIV